MSEKDNRIMTFFKRGPHVSTKDLKYLRSEDGYWMPTLVYTYTKSESMTEEYDSSDTISLISHSTNATMDDIPGTGRVMGNFYQSLGRKLENTAMRFGFVNPPPAQILRHFTHKYDSRWLCLTYWEPPSDYPGVIEDMTGQDIVGLKSLVKQTRSNSLYRSASALTALIRLSTLTERYIRSFPQFYMVTAQREPIFHLAKLAKALDDAHPEKELFLSLVCLARAQLNIVIARTQSRSRGSQAGIRPTIDALGALARSFRKRLMVILESKRKPGCDVVAVIGNVCALLANIEPHMRFWTENGLRTDRFAVESTAETAYFSINLLLHALFSLQQHSNEAPLEFYLSELQRSLLSTFIYYIDITMKDMLKRLSGRVTSNLDIVRFASLLRSPFHAFQECAQWFPLTFGMTNEPILKAAVLPRRVRVTRPSNEIPPIIMDYVRAWIPRSRQLALSLDEIKREAGGCTSNFAHLELPNIINPSREDFKNGCKRSLSRAQQAQVEDISLTSEFRVGRKDGHWYWESWEYYKRNCELRQRWSAILCSNLDWDRDTSKDLKQLFKIGKPAISASNKRRATLDISFAAKKLNLFEEIQVPYETDTGEIKYRIFKASPSADDIHKLPLQPDEDARDEAYPERFIPSSLANMSRKTQKRRNRLWRRQTDKTMMDIWMEVEWKMEEENEIS